MEEVAVTTTVASASVDVRSSVVTDLESESVVIVLKGLHVRCHEGRELVVTGLDDVLQLLGGIGLVAVHDTCLVTRVLYSLVVGQHVNASGHPPPSRFRDDDLLVPLV